MIPTAIILAGGFGTRLKSVVQSLPKPLAPVRNKPFLDYQLNWLQQAGCRHVIFSTGHLAEKISAQYGERYLDISLSYSFESTPLGTGGAVKQAIEARPENEFLVLNGDSLFAIDLPDFHRKHQQCAAECSIALRSVEDAARYGKIVTDISQRVTAFVEKKPGHEPGLINGGVYLLNREPFLKNSPAQKQFSIENDFFAARLSEVGIYGFLFDSYFIDIGIPEDYQRAQHEFERFEDR